MPKTLRFPNGISIELATQGKAFLGLGRVCHRGVALRSGRLPMFVDIRNPDGVELSDYRLKRVRRAGRGFVLSFDMKALARGPMEWQLHECRRLCNTTDWTATPAPAADTTLELELQPVTRRLGPNRFDGFSYRYRYQSKSIPIYYLTDRGSWEPGGKAVGNEFWFRSCFAPSVYRPRTLGEYYSTEWYLPDCHNPNIFQYPDASET